jgi:hypothetical protein
MSGTIPPLPSTPTLRGTQLKHRDNFTFTLLWKIQRGIGSLLSTVFVKRGDFYSCIYTIIGSQGSSVA